MEDLKDDELKTVGDDKGNLLFPLEFGRELELWEEDWLNKDSLLSLDKVDPEKIIFEEEELGDGLVSPSEEGDERSADKELEGRSNFELLDANEGLLCPRGFEESPENDGLGWAFNIFVKISNKIVTFTKQLISSWSKTFCKKTS